MAPPPSLRYSRPAVPDEQLSEPDTSSQGALALKSLVPGLLVEGRYSLTERIGEGGMAQVWEAMQTTTGRKVALKFVPVASSQAAKRAQREAQIVAKLRHANVVELHDSFTISTPCDAVVLVLERLSGQSLQQTLRLSGRMPFPVVADVGRCILQALALAHSQGIVHRDIKPSNVFVSTESGWHAKVLDFGVAKASRAANPTASTLTQHGGKPGTLAYMSPEQFLGETEITPAADVWAAGVVLFEALTGAHPFRGGETTDLVRNILLGQSNPLRPLVEREHVLVPTGIIELIERMISLDANKRPKNASEALQQWNDAVQTPMLGAEGDSPVHIGDIIEGRYEVTNVLGQGGMAMVVGAKHLRLGTPVAIKMSFGEFSASPVGRERFLREAQAAASLKSPHVAKVSDFGILPDGTPFMVIEYLEGRDLGDRVRRDSTPMSVEEAVDCVVEAADALAEAHARGIVHRDVKPSNLFLANDGRGGSTLKVLDFGIAKGPSSATGDLTHTTEAFGSPHYMSPEQIRSTKLVDPRSDVWSLGVVLYELLTGTQPFVGDSPASVVAAIVADPAPRVSELRPVPAAIDAVVAACLSKDPAGRPQSAEQLARTLAPYGGERARAAASRLSPSSASERAPMAPPSLASVAPAIERPRAPSYVESQPQPKTSRKHVAMVVGAVTLLAGGVAIALWPASGTVPPQPSPALPVVESVPPPPPTLAPTNAVQETASVPPVLAAPAETTTSKKPNETPAATTAAAAKAPKSAAKPAVIKPTSQGAGSTVGGGGSFD